MNERSRFATLIAIGVVALLIAAFAALRIGPGEFSLADVIAVVFAKLSGAPTERAAEAIVWDLRVPRVLLALLIGAALGSAGALTQGLFRNPLASPDVLGISTGAAAAVITGFALGLDEHAAWVNSLLAGLGSLSVLALLFGLTGKRSDLAYLLLTGVAINALVGAIATVVLALFLDRYALAQKAMAWTLGSFDGRGFRQLAWAGPSLLAGLLAAWSLHRPLDLLYLGEETAATLGLDRARLRVIAALVIGVLVGVSTAAVGVIGFVGLIVPHLARALPGVGAAGHARLLPTSMLLGAALLLGVDTLGRALTPLFLAPGALTSLLGGVFFLWLLRRFAGGPR
ncbi:FecCD family ABC transporter permease [Nannocystaceae bacterium ST9]